MSNRSKPASRLSALALGALLGGLPASAAVAETSMSPQDAEAMAQHYRDQAEHYSALGGVGYKTGLVQRADADAARYSEMAEALAAPPAEPPAESPKAEHYAKLAEHYQAMGGVGYKAGLVQSAEAQERKYEPVGEGAAPPASQESASQETTAPCPATKPAVQTSGCAK